MLGRKRRSAPIFQNSTRGRERYAGRRLLPSLTVVCKIQWHDEKIASNAQTSLCATRSAPRVCKGGYARPIAALPADSREIDPYS